MAIPEYEVLKPPALQLFTDGVARRVPDVEKPLARQFDLTADDLAEMLPSGTETRWHNRVMWACYDLFRAGLLERVKRGTYRITEAGMQVAAENPPSLNRDYLMQFPSFAEWMTKTGTPKAKQAQPSSAGASEAQPQTPAETIEAAHAALQAAVKAELREQIAAMDPYRFEQLVVDLLVAMGYGGSREEAARVTKASNDEGIDGVINEDRLGLDVLYVQAKRWKENVGRKEIQSFVGALAGQQAHKGVFITTSGFSASALDYARGVPQKVVLIDGDRLAELMIEHDIGVTTTHAYVVKRVDSDYFEG